VHIGAGVFGWDHWVRVVGREKGGGEREVNLGVYRETRNE